DSNGLAALMVPPPYATGPSASVRLRVVDCVGATVTYGARAYQSPGPCGKCPDESRICRRIVTFRPSFFAGLGVNRTLRNRGLMPTIALVDDDRNILTSVSIALEAEGYRIMTYTDGASALDGFKTSPPDLAILDIKMPRMDGMETLRRLRQKSDMPVIFLTSKDEEIDELFGLKMGADDFIRKPFSQRLL